MTQLSRVLVVTSDSHLADTLDAWLTEAGCHADVTRSFVEGREHLECAPAIVVTELRLGAYNGLHLALKARAKGIPAVVVGDGDVAMEREAGSLGAAYLNVTELTKSDVQLLINVLQNRSGDGGGLAALDNLPFSVAWATAIAARGAAMPPQRFLLH
jgi:DNA-binding response OmpR family regulator